jgi:alkylmercury lyase
VNTGVDTAEIAEQLTCCVRQLDEGEQRMQIALFRLLVQGEPVEPTRLAEHTGLPVSEVVDLLGRWPQVHTDDDARVVAFQGLSVVEAPHRLRVDGRTLFTWCAWDTLFLPELIGRPAEIQSRCPTTGRTVSLRVGPEGPSDASPPEAMLSFLVGVSPSSDDVIESFCRFVHFFASTDAAQAWTGQHPGTFFTSIDEGFQIGRRTNAAQWGDALRSIAN